MVHSLIVFLLFISTQVSALDMRISGDPDSSENGSQRNGQTNGKPAGIDYEAERRKIDNPYAYPYHQSLVQPFIANPIVQKISEALPVYERKSAFLVKISDSVQTMDQPYRRSQALKASGRSLLYAKDYTIQGQFEEASIAQDISDIFLDIATGTLPGLSWGRDVYEAIIGKDLINGDKLEGMARVIPIFGAITAGFGSKAIKATKVFQKLVHGSRYADDFATIRKLLYEKPLSELKSTMAFFKKHCIWQNTDIRYVSFSNAFMKNSKVKVLDEDLAVYRYFPASKEAKGNWYTNKLLDNPQADLAIPKPGPYEYKRAIIPKGTEVMEGIVAPFEQHKGGAYQIYSAISKEIN